MDYHYIVVGGGAAGCMAAYRLSKKYPNKRIVILEINSNTLDDYKVDYSQSAQWVSAMPSSSGYSKSFQSRDGKSVWVGKGLGGGTLHFGLQYIDTGDLIFDAGDSTTTARAYLIDALTSSASPTRDNIIDSRNSN